MVRRRSHRKISLTATARKDLEFWQVHNPRIVQKINLLLESILLDPIKGIRKPERLKYKLSGDWPRRITLKDRMVYKVHNNTRIILQLRDRY